MTKPARNVRVRTYEWDNKDGTTTPAIRINAGAGFTVIPYDIARQIVDEIHDLCDAYEAEQRDKT